MLSRANGRHTVPQIFIGDRHVGGSDDLAALEAGRRARLPAPGLSACASPFIQARTGVDPAANAAALAGAVAEAGAGGAAMLFTPEMSGLLDRDRARASVQYRREADDPVLARVRAAAAQAGIWVALGSLALLADADEGTGGEKLVNRSFLIDGSGAVRARYDKIHLFDVDLPTGESWRESASFAAGAQPVVADSPLGPIGLSICYDLRFAELYAALSGAGAVLLSVPAAFTVPTGEAHWHVLMRARAIESACFLVAAAQCGTHQDGRATYGHSLVVDPWGRILLDMGSDSPALGFADLDLAEVDAVRARLPVLAHRRALPPVRKE
jgi:predicted amidohydrolase